MVYKNSAWKMNSVLLNFFVDIFREPSLLNLTGVLLIHRRTPNWETTGTAPLFTNTHFVGGRGANGLEICAT